MNIKVLLTDWGIISAVLLAILILLGIFLLGPCEPSGPADTEDPRSLNGYSDLTPD